MIRFASPIASGAQASSSSQSAWVAASSSSGAATLFAKPIRCASAPSITRPVMISSFARPTPITAGSRDDPPRSGTSPTRASSRPVTASSAITRMSHASASSIAPPRHAPWICAIVGFVISSSRFQMARISRRYARTLSGSSANRFRSARSIPDENIAPSPRTTTTRTASSSAAVRIASPSSRTSSPLSALRFSGLASTMWRTAPWSSVSTSGM